MIAVQPAIIAGEAHEAFDFPPCLCCCCFFAWRMDPESVPLIYSAKPDLHDGPFILGHRRRYREVRIGVSFPSPQKLIFPWYCLAPCGLVYR